MIKIGKVIIITVVLFSLIISGCTDKESSTQEKNNLSSSADQNLSIADELLSQEMVGITDTEIQDLESNLAELEKMLNTTEQEEDINIEDI